jgi:hypothetical protein
MELTFAVCNALTLNAFAKLFYSRDAKDCAETSHGKINSFGRGNEVNSKKYKNKVYGRTGKKLDGNALAEAKSQRRNDVRRADRNPAAAR